MGFQEDGSLKFTSYGNSLHPTRYPEIYRVIETLATTALPLWDQCLAVNVSYKRRPGPEDCTGGGRLKGLTMATWQEPKIGTRRVEKYKDSGLQVIVKIASIKLTPDKPGFAGGAWHVESQMNERIVGTALSYLDSENITESCLELRMSTNARPAKVVISPFPMSSSIASQPRLQDSTRPGHRRFIAVWLVDPNIRIKNMGMVPPQHLD
ncbi:hypothetical protein MCOR31_011090 [Pyricularia oryzae]|nr:hypothetical protein MCOR26_006213 [Pyricularia oryzae]KAI6355779.1 hypothetical protein MCOR31_011090 [Pyricularia oryzae]